MEMRGRNDESADRSVKLINNSRCSMNDVYISDTFVMRTLLPRINDGGQIIYSKILDLPAVAFIYSKKGGILMIKLKKSA